MALANTKLELKNMNVEDEVFIDNSIASNLRTSIATDYANLKADCNNIKKICNTVSVHKGTKGKFKTSLTKLTTAYKKRVTATTKATDILKKSLNNDIQEYGMALMAKRLKELEEKIAKLEAASGNAE